MSAIRKLAADYVIFFVITKRPCDLPDWPFVVRPQTADAGGPLYGNIACLCRSLDEARAGPAELGAYCFAPHPSDDPAIVESWML